MSAIAGMVLWRGGDPGGTVRAALAHLAPHGPDNQGYWEDGSVALGWRQSVLHHEDYADAQPLAGGGGRFQFLFDGRLDNRADLARTLSLPKETHEWPDSRFALAAFERWSEDCPAQLVGDYAFAVWDAARREIFLARDQAGGRGLFYAPGSDFLLFASTPSALFTSAKVERAIDRDNFVLDQARVLLPRDQTIYRGIRRVPVGGWVRISEGQIVQGRHWRPEEVAPLRYTCHADYAEAFRDIFEEAVRARLRSLHPVGSQLSAGWDSSVATVTAARQLAADGVRLTAFTSVPPSTWTGNAASRRLENEGPMAALVAKHVANIDHVLVEDAGYLDLEALDRRMDFLCWPPYALLSLTWNDRLYREARARGVRVMLTGLRGNCSFSWDGLGLLAFLFRRGHWLRLVRECAALRRNEPLTARGLAAFAVLPTLPPKLREWIDRARGIEPPTALLRFGIRGGALPARRLRAAVSAMHPIAWGYRGDERSDAAYCNLGPDLNLVWNGIEAQYGIDSRDPFSDRRVMNFRAGLSDAQFLFSGHTKQLARTVGEALLPPDFLRQRHRGLQAADWQDALGRVSGPLLAELSRAVPEAEAMFDVEGLRACLEEWDVPAAPAVWQRRQHAVVTVAAMRFLRRFGTKSENS